MRKIQNIFQYKNRKRLSLLKCVSFLMFNFYLLIPRVSFAGIIEIGHDKKYGTILSAIRAAHSGDTLLVYRGFYREGNIVIDKALTLRGIQYPIIDGGRRNECLTIRANEVIVEGFLIQKSGYSTLEDPGGIKIYNSRGTIIRNNILLDNFFGVYLSYCRNCVVKNNYIRAYRVLEHQIGNGIHCWKSDSLKILSNRISGHRDGIYFEFVSQSLISKNISKSNLRYGLHFMFSNDDSYILNRFNDNGAGVAVMFSKRVNMYQNYFEENWGDAAYGILLKEISDSEIRGNVFRRNTAALYLEGANRIEIDNNQFVDNGWAMKIQASCMDNNVRMNNFRNNTFDCSTNGDLVLNKFDYNYWDKYEGYDLNKDTIGDVPYHPLSLFNVIVERNPPVMILFRSFMVGLLEQSEKVIPSLTPDQFQDSHPKMKPYQG